MQWLAHHSGSRVPSPLCCTAQQLGNLYGMGGIGIAISFVSFGLSIFEQKYFTSNARAIIRGVRIRGFASGAVWRIRLPTERLMWLLYAQCMIDVKSLSCSCKTNTQALLRNAGTAGERAGRAGRRLREVVWPDIPLRLGMVCYWNTRRSTDTSECFPSPLLPWLTWRAEFHILV